MLSGCPSIAALFANGPYPYATFTGSVAQAIRPWPQYQKINWRFFNYGESHYNALQVSFERRMGGGWSGAAKVAYTYSSLMNNGAEQGLGQVGLPSRTPAT